MDGLGNFRRPGRLCAAFSLQMTYDKMKFFRTLANEPVKLSPSFGGSAHPESQPLVQSGD